MLFRKLRILQLRILFLALLSLSLFGLIFSFYSRKNIKACFVKSPKQLENSIDAPKLLDDVLNATIKPIAGHSIFFHETSCRESQTDSIFDLFNIKPKHYNFANLTKREACAVESAALHNPNLNIFVLFASPVFENTDKTENPIINAVLTYPNVHFRNLDMWSYATGTPIAKWFNTDKLFESRYVLSHISDFLRYLTLWRWGGTYLDLDVVVLTNLEQLPPNYTGAESENFLAAGVMNFGAESIGKKVANYCLEDFEKHFNGRDWGNNGPGVITRALKHVCQAHHITDMFDKERCLGFTVFKRDAFYAVPWKQWADFFDTNKTDETLKSLEHSYVAHVWNKHSKQRLHHIGDRGAYGELAAKHCPKVYASVGEYF